MNAGAEQFGHDVLGPIMAEFSLRLWSLGALVDRPGDTAFLFCARGGLRMQLAHQRFLRAAGLDCPVPQHPVMVSRLVAMRASLLRTLRTGGPQVGPFAASTLAYEFRHASVGEAAYSLTGVRPAGDPARWELPLDPSHLVALLRVPEGAAVVEALVEQGELFERHLRHTLDGRGRAVLVDTGLYGTTQGLLAEAEPDLLFSSALLARSYRPGPTPGSGSTAGLSVEAEGYTPLRRRTALLRYWHFVEWFLEPELPSVRTFADDGGAPRSNLEVDGWRAHVEPDPGSPFAGVLAYLDGLPAGPGETVVADATRAWRRLHSAVVWPRRADGERLQVGTRSHDFGLAGTWGQRGWRGPVAALRGSSMWREGEIARSGSPLRLPLLAAIESGYAGRLAVRAARRRLLPGR
ncbi:hypothetical protein [Pseudonocardia alni]|uniref:hypothetical protein n=1 Tax=Pseudonocardia alni TaxID=33907 RepID=UPI0027A3EA5A|nr:glycosyltransferase [Pseudonocardia alni]